MANLRDLARQQPQDVGPHRTLAEIALYEGRPDEFLRESSTTASLRSDATGLADVQRWRAAGSSPQRIEEMMLHDAQKVGTGWFRIARLASLIGQRDEAKKTLARACDAHESAAISAPGDFWLSRTLSPDDITAQCGRAYSLL